MKTDHPDLTTYALGEMNEAERLRFEEELQFQPEFNAEIEAISKMGRLLARGLAEEPNRLTSEQRETIWREIGLMPKNVVPMRASNWPRVLLAISASAACLCVAYYALSMVTLKEQELAKVPTAQPDETAPLAITMEDAAPAPAPDWLTIAQGEFTERQGADRPESWDLEPELLPEPNELPYLASNDFVSVEDQPETELPVQSGKASYPWVRGFLDEAQDLPPRDAVRIEELVNAFPYSEPRDEISGRVAIGMRLVDCPWDSDSWLLGILLRNTSSVDPVQMKARLHVVDRAVSEYRLLGFAQREDKEGRDRSGLRLPEVLEPGKSQFVIYEMRKRDGYEARMSSELALLTVQSRIKNRSWDNSRLSCRVEDRSWLSESDDFRFAALMTAFGEALREDDRNRAYSLDSVSDLADVMISATGPGRLTAPQKEAVELIRKAKDLAAERE